MESEKTATAVSFQCLRRARGARSAGDIVVSRAWKRP
jgi:hypothetical protein